MEWKNVLEEHWEENDHSKEVYFPFREEFIPPTEGSVTHCEETFAPREDNALQQQLQKFSGNFFTFFALMEE